MAEDACPVDHKTRDAWLAQARAAEASKTQLPSSTTSPSPSQPHSQPSQCPVDHSSSSSAKQSSWTQTISSYIWSTPSPTHPTIPSSSTPPRPSTLETSRITSSIPRSFTPLDESCPVDHGASANPPSNAELESGADAASGNWVYPSEKMFFEAMKRKGYDAREVDMKTVVPIHNAVNERAWQQIKEWEAPYLAESKCVFVLLLSFLLFPSSHPLTPIPTLMPHASQILIHNRLHDELLHVIKNKTNPTQMLRPQTRLLRQQEHPHDPNRPHQHHPRLHRAL